MKRELDFNWYQKAKTDVIRNAAYELIKAITSKSTPPRAFEFSIPPWNEELIATIIKYAIMAIDEKLGYTCVPFYQEGQTPCYEHSWCDNPHCIFRAASRQDSAVEGAPEDAEKGGDCNG